jgi:hypothetical protein
MVTEPFLFPPQVREYAYRLNREIVLRPMHVFRIESYFGTSSKLVHACGYLITIYEGRMVITPQDWFINTMYAK